MGTRGLRTNSDEARAAIARARAALNPSPETLHLESLRFVAKTVREARALGVEYNTEPKQYIAAYTARRQELGHLPATLEAEQLRRASQALWRVREASDMPPRRRLITRPS